jgi:hypothetical protein
MEDWAKNTVDLSSAKVPKKKKRCRKREHTLLSITGIVLIVMKEGVSSFLSRSREFFFEKGPYGSRADQGACQGPGCRGSTRKHILSFFFFFFFSPLGVRFLFFAFLSTVVLRTCVLRIRPLFSSLSLYSVHHFVGDGSDGNCGDVDMGLNVWAELVWI